MYVGSVLYYLIMVHISISDFRYPVHGVGVALVLHVVRVRGSHLLHHNADVELRLLPQHQRSSEIAYQLGVICKY